MNLTRAKLIEILSEEVGLTQRASKEVLAVFFDAIIKSLGSGQDVRLRKFGRFQIVKGRKGGNGLSGGNGDRPPLPRKVVRFRCSKFLKACVNDGGAECSAWPAEFDQIYDNLISTDRLQTILDNHGLWLASHGKKGKRTDLAGCNLQWADLEEVDLRDVKLSGACLAKAYLSDANLEDADLENANLEGACLAGASLKRANLRGASLRGADLRESDFQDADLSGADLQYADLSGAELRDARFTNCRFFRTNLKNTLLDRKSTNPWGSLRTRLRSALKPKPVAPWGETD
jgi:nucleoid DNA-binding protein